MQLKYRHLVVALGSALLFASISTHGSPLHRLKSLLSRGTSAALAATEQNFKVLDAAGDRKADTRLVAEDRNQVHAKEITVGNINGVMADQTYELIVNASRTLDENAELRAQITHLREFAAAVDSPVGAAAAHAVDGDTASLNASQSRKESENLSFEIIVHESVLAFNVGPTLTINKHELQFWLDIEYQRHVHMTQNTNVDLERIQQIEAAHAAAAP